MVNNSSGFVKRNKTSSYEFNKMVANAVKNYEFRNSKNISKSKYKTEKEYQDSFSDILEFQKKFTDAQKKDINVVIFHSDNNDGMVSAYIAWKYLMLDNGKDVKFLGMKPGKGQFVDSRVKGVEHIIRDKNVIILDIDHSAPTLDYIKNITKEMIVIDDHSGGMMYKDPKVFIGSSHAAVAYTFKFFYPNDKVPKIVQYVDDSDAKLFLPFIPLSDLFTSALGFRFVHNIFMSSGPQTFEKMHELFKNDNVNFLIFLGKYFEEVRNNIKDQIATNARPVNFQGYRVGVLNFNAPSLSKPVGRQIISNMNKKEKVIDFAVLWGYEYSLYPPAYRVQIIDDHVQTKINMKEIAEKLGKIGGHPKSGGGHMHVGNFYWSKDIFDLFKKQYL